MTTRLLDRVNGPADLKALPADQLDRLAQEIRDEIVRVVGQNGGHLASNLGVVELTIALHRAFDAPRDKIVWDTGNQAYTHKLLTGRREGFPTLRQLGGLSGFARKEESAYDLFSFGHAGTGISAALGLAEARDRQGETHKVIVVIGDGALTAGLAFEGLNNAGGLKKDLIVVLNDNEMSISRNVGAISAYLNRIITGQLYTRVRSETGHLLGAIPRIGKSVLRVAKKAEESVKGLLTPGLLFEELGFQYVGPIDGHRLDHLLPTLKNLKRLRGPILLHVITKKGKGYRPAEEDPIGLHSPGPPAKVEKARTTPAVPTYTTVFVETLIRLARADRRLVAITAAMAEGTGLVRFAKAFPDRCYDVGIAEPHAVTFAAGLATNGLRPVVAIYSTFLQRAYDQIAHDVCLQRLPVVFCLDRAGLVGEDGPTHHGIFDLAYLRHLPGLVVMAPRDENELQQMLITALAHDDGPVAIRYPRGQGVGVPLEPDPRPLPLGKAELLDEGDDLVLLALGSMVHPAREAAKRLRADGVAAAVVNARFVKPLDHETILAQARRVGRLITVEEHALAGGFGSAVLELLETAGLYGIGRGVEVTRLGLPDQFIEHGGAKTLRQRCRLDADGIVEAALRSVGRGVGRNVGTRR